MATLTRAEILARKVGNGIVTLSDGATVEVRGCTRAEARQIQDVEEGDQRDAAMISFGLVDPALTPDEVLAWFADAPNGDILKITGKILELSGMAEGQGKDATKSVPR
jgi:hypothetical protein